jgi:hypothetical protein
MFLHAVLNMKALLFIFVVGVCALAFSVDATAEHKVRRAQLSEATREQTLLAVHRLHENARWYASCLGDRMLEGLSCEKGGNGRVGT